MTAGIVILSAGILAAWTQGEDPAVLLRAAIEREGVNGANRAEAAQALLRPGARSWSLAAGSW